MSSDKPTQRTRAAAIAVAASGSVAALAFSGRTRLLRWGATDEEIVASQPGDDLINEPNVTATRAITIRRSPDVIWPWVAQIGQGRGGFYSYDFLENMLGFDIHSADQLVPEWREIEVGDEVRLAAKAGLSAAIVEPGRALVLQGSLPIARRPRLTQPGRSFLISNPMGRRVCSRASATATVAGGLRLLSSPRRRSAS